MNDHPIQSALLKAMAFSGVTDNRLAGGRAFLCERVNQFLEREGMPGIGAQTFMRAVWQAVASGLAYIDFSQPDPGNWTLEMTDAGARAEKDASYLPDNVPACLRRIAEDINDLSDRARLYLEEALRCFTSRNFLASTMMLGVGAEAVFYDCAYPFADWLKDASGPNFRGTLDRVGAPLSGKLIEFQRRLAVHKDKFPPEIAKCPDLHVNSVNELIRLARNDVGHPTGIGVERESAFQYLVVFPLLARRFHLIKRVCEA